MRVVTISNLKGGVGKTTSAVNMAIILCTIYKKKVLLVDNDSQGNVSRYFNLYDYNKPSMEDIIRSPETDVMEVIRNTSVSGLDLIPSNFNLDAAVIDLQLDQEAEQNTRLKVKLESVEKNYDYCIIDCPPSLGMNVINAFSCTDDVIIPIKLDKNSLDGMEELVEIIDEMKEFNPRLKGYKCLITMFQNQPEIVGGEQILRKSGYEVFAHTIRFSKKVISCSFETEAGIVKFSPRSAAAIDYKRFVAEYLEGVE